MIVRFVLMLIVILLPAFLAGFRDLSLGIDIKVYVIPTFDCVKESTGFLQAVKDVDDLKYIDSINVGLIIIEYIVSALKGNIHGVLFGIALVNGVCVFIAAYIKRDEVELWVIELVYLTMLYNATYNAMRQCMAICFGMVAFAYLLKNKIVLFSILTLIDMILFHNTAILIFLVLPLYYFMKKNISKDKSSRKFSTKSKYGIVICGISLIILFFRPIVGLVDSIFQWNFSRYWEYYKSDFSIPRLTMYIITMIPLFLYERKEKHKELLTSVAIIDLFTYLLSFSIFYFYRVSLYYMMLCKSFGYGEILYELKNHKTNKRLKINIKTIMILAICILYWFYTYVYANMHETVPYKMK